jgi:hypothetical protein
LLRTFAIDSRITQSELLFLESKANFVMTGDPDLIDIKETETRRTSKPFL